MDNLTTVASILQQEALVIQVRGLDDFNITTEAPSGDNGNVFLTIMGAILALMAIFFVTCLCYKLCECWKCRDTLPYTRRACSTESPGRTITPMSSQDVYQVSSITNSVLNQRPTDRMSHVVRLSYPEMQNHMLCQQPMSELPPEYAPPQVFPDEPPPTYAEVTQRLQRARGPSKEVCSKATRHLGSDATATTGSGPFQTSLNGPRELNNPGVTQQLQHNPDAPKLP